MNIENLENEIQSWVAVQSEHSCQLAGDVFVVCAEDLAEFIKDLFEKEKTKLEGCVVVLESEYNEMAQFKDLYKRAIVNAKKRKDQLNWAHVAGLGVGSTKAIELLKEFGIDPSATSMHAMVEAARSGK